MCVSFQRYSATWRRDEHEDSLRIPITIAIANVALDPLASAKEAQIGKLLTVWSQALCSRYRETRDLDHSPLLVNNFDFVVDNHKVNLKNGDIPKPALRCMGCMILDGIRRLKMGWLKLGTVRLIIN